MQQLNQTATSFFARPLAELCDEVIARLRPEGLQDDVALVAIRLHREDPSPSPRLGTAVRSRLDGQWVVTLSRRFRDREGRFGGVAVDVRPLAAYGRGPQAEALRADLLTGQGSQTS